MRLGSAAIAVAIIIALALGVIILLPEEGQQPAPAEMQNGTVQALEFGRAGEYGYVTFSHSGSGSVELLALSEPPKSEIIVLRKDLLNTERYTYFMDLLRPLESKGFTITEVEAIGEPNNTIIIIPSSAMPEDVLLRLDNLSASNRIIYIGKADLLYSDRLLKSEWLANLSNYTKAHLTIVEKTLDEFYLGKNYSLFSEIEMNAWAVENSTSFSYSGKGISTVFVPLGNADWLRMLPLSDSNKLPEPSAEIEGDSEVFPWQRAQVTIELNYTNGTAYYSLEKDGKQAQGGELARVRSDEAFLLTFSFQSSGDYIVRVYDASGTLGAKRIHVRNLSISLASAYGNLYEFDVLLDGEPLERAEAQVGLNHSSNIVDAEIRNGKLSLRAGLREGENVFVISIFGHKNFISYMNSQEGLLAFYAKYLGLGLVVVGAFYVAMRMNRKPVYRISVPEGVFASNPEVKVSAKALLSSMEGVEKGFGWNGVPLYAKEIGFGLKHLTGGMEVNEGNVEAVMKTLEERGLVKSHLGLYSLPSWGDHRKNALKRIIRDKLISSGTEFKETSYGFSCAEHDIVLDAEKAKRDSIVVFEDQDSVKSYLSSLEGKARARIYLKMRNGVLRLAALDELDELL